MKSRGAAYCMRDATAYIEHREANKQCCRIFVRLAACSGETRSCNGHWCASLTGFLSERTDVKMIKRVPIDFALVVKMKPGHCTYCKNPCRRPIVTNDWLEPAQIEPSHRELYLPLGRDDLITGDFVDTPAGLCHDHVLLDMSAAECPQLPQGLLILAQAFNAH